MCAVNQDPGATLIAGAASTPPEGPGGCYAPPMRRAFFIGSVLLCATACGTDDRAVPDAGPAPVIVPPVWTIEVGVPTNQDLLAVWGRSATDVYAVGWNGTVVHYDGTAWRQETTTSTVPLTAVHGRPLAEDARPEDPLPPTMAVGWGGTILERSPSGAWAPSLSTSTRTEDLFGLALGADDGGLAVGDRGHVIGWDGTTWTALNFTVPGEFSGEPIAPKGVLKGVWSGNGRRYYITGSGGASYRSASGYQSFEALDTRISDPLRGVWGSANDNVYAVGLDSLILRFSGQWRRVTNEGADLLPRTFLFGVAGAAADDITCVGWKGIAVRRVDGAWIQEETGVNNDLRGVWVDTETGIAFAVGTTGTVIRRTPPPEPVVME